MSLGFNELKGGVLASEILKRPNVKYSEIKNFIPELQEVVLDEQGEEELEVLVKYEGYIAKQIKEAKNMMRLEEMLIPSDVDYLHMDGLALEARSKLDKVRPLNIGQASRISGVNPADISMLILNLKKANKNE